MGREVNRAPTVRAAPEPAAAAIIRNGFHVHLDPEFRELDAPSELPTVCNLDFA
jgi:hypothetical protein